ncbi:hypothetical protein KHC28_11340 [Ancylobacter sonchi]|uniref:hypothetical protein n=1 Tax=Ancylobacter sonchi TaxID=1937790 RepID=UPI001BD29F8D|nr:hypothetical protein [Ancylobacter sonchi]MBS7534252.1 hypothetical protein [Ancylobacter sonchi]
MTDDSAVVRVDLARPPWLLDPVISIGDAAKLLDLPENTLSHWLAMAKALGVPLHQKISGSRRLTPHSVYVAGVLASLYRARFPASDEVFIGAHRATHRAGVPVLPHLFESVDFSHSKADGKPVARALVDLSAVWLSLQSDLERLAT